MGSLLADRFSESISAYSEGVKVIDRKILKEYLTQNWTTLEDLQSNEVCLQIGRQLGATGVILGTLTEDKDSVNLTLNIEGLGPKAKKKDLLPWRGRTASLLLTEEAHRMLIQPGSDYARKADEIPEEPGIFKTGSPGVTTPSCIRCFPAVYTGTARAAKFQGTVLLSVIVTPEGRVTSIYVLKGAPFGLTEKFIEAVRHWSLKPGEKDGKSVSVRLQIETTFHLY